MSWKAEWKNRFTRPIRSNKDILRLDCTKLNIEAETFIDGVVNTKLQRILDHGHGGGNWRRLVIMEMEKEERLKDL